MPNEILPINNLSEIGLIMDTPSVSLPPNAFSNCSNVRFRDGAIRKFPGLDEVIGFGSLTGVDYAVQWEAPEGIKYVIIAGTTLTVYNDAFASIATHTVLDSSDWQHTLFNGGFHIILNNGIQTPVYIEDHATLPSISPLPGWDSYAVETQLVNFEATGEDGVMTSVNATLTTGTRIRITATPRSVADPIRTETVTVNAGVDGVDPDGTLVNIGTIGGVTATGFNFTPADGAGGTSFRIAIVSVPVTSVTATVIRSYGNLLVAGNLREGGGAGRTLTGTVRTSDVAGPGQIPTNWNPFMNGVNTADEFILASTGEIQDMVELQGVLYVYTNSSIHSIQQTGSPVIPFQVGVVTDNYGADRVDSVVEIDGKHLVIGSDDVYIFAGHPGSISSVAEGRVRNMFRGDNNYKAVRYNSYDEIWFHNGTVEIPVWNYRNNTWTVRTVTTIPVSLTSGLNDLFLATSTTISTVNDRVTYATNSFVERRRLAITPEFDTENLASIALLTDGGGTIAVTAAGSNIPGDESVMLDDAADANFDVTMDYKQDLRVHGRFLNYRLTHSSSNNMNIAGMQFDIGKGGRR